MDVLFAQQVAGDAVTESFSLLQAAQVVVAVVGAIVGVGYAAYRQAKKRADGFIGTYIDQASDRASSSAFDQVNGSLNGIAQKHQQDLIVSALEDIKAHFGIVPDPDPILVAQIRAIVSDAVRAELAAISAE